MAILECEFFYKNSFDFLLVITVGNKVSSVAYMLLLLCIVEDSCVLLASIIPFSQSLIETLYQQLTRIHTKNMWFKFLRRKFKKAVSKPVHDISERRREGKF